MERQPQPSDDIEVNGFAWASLIIGSISLFYADRLAYPNPSNYFFVTLLIPAAGVASAYLAHRRIDTRTRGRELAVAGAVLSIVSAVVLTLTKLFVT